MVIFPSELGHSVCMSCKELQMVRWSRSKVCQVCDMGEDETVEHVVLECEKYERNRM